MNNTKPGKKFRTVKRIIQVSAALILLLFLTVFILIQLYKNDLKEYAIEYFEKEAKITLGNKDISLDLWGHFPDLALAINSDSSFQFVNSNGKNLLTVEKIELLFNIPDLFSKKFNVKHIVLENGKAWFSNIKNHINELNTSNRDNPDEINMTINSAFLSNITLFFDQGHYNKIEIIESKINGNWTQSNKYLNISLLGNLFISIKSNPKYQLNELSTELEIIYNEKEKQFEIINGRLDYKNLIHLNPENSFFTNHNLKINATFTKSDISDITNILPEPYKSDIETQDFDGNIEGRIVIDYDFDENQHPVIESNFSLSDANLLFDKSFTEFSHINSDGEYFSSGNEKISRLHLNNISLFYKGQKVEGYLHINNFKKPLIKARINGIIDITEFSDILIRDSLTLTQGTVNADIKYKRQRTGWGPIQPQDFVFSHTAGKLDKIKLKLKSKNEIISFEDGTLRFNNNDIEAKNVKLKYKKAILNTDILSRDFFSAVLFGEKPVILNFSAKSPFIDINEIIPLTDLFSYGKERHNKTSFTPEINMYVSFDSIKYDRLLVRNIRGSAKLNKDKVTISDMEFSAFGGNVSSICDISYNDQFYEIDITSTVVKADIKKVFIGFDNFGQNTLSWNNLDGIADLSVDLNMHTDRSFKVITSSIVSDVDIEIRNGWLKDFKPLVETLKFLKKDSVDHIRFSKLTNQIRIKDQKVNIPQMEIESNIYNFSGFGFHQFDGCFDYHLKVLMSELWSGKRNELNENISQYGYLVDDEYGKTSIFFHLFGKNEEINFKYDKNAVLEKIANDFRREKQKIKTEFAKEFKWLKRDSLKKSKHKQMQKSIEKQEEGKFIIKWDQKDPE